jgi:hypothetical protein
MVNAPLMATPLHRGAFAKPCYRADRGAIASAMAHPTMTREVTAPALILSFSGCVVAHQHLLFSAHLRRR